MIHYQSEMLWQAARKVNVHAIKLCLFLFLAWQSVPNDAVAVNLQPGDILVADFSQNAIFRVDPNSGDRTVVSSNTVGTGPMLASPTSLALEADGSILVSTRFDFVYRVDPATGNRTEVSGPSQGTGAELLQPTGIEVANDGTIFLSDGGEGLSTTVAVRRIDPSSGNREVISDFTMGSGDFFFGPSHITLNDDQNVLLAADESAFLVDVMTGDRTRISGAGNGAGLGILRSTGIEVSTEGKLVLSGNLRVNDVATPSLFEVDPVTGDRLQLSGGTVGSGVALRDTQGFAFVDNNTVVMGQDQTRSLLSIDLQTGNRSVLSAGDNSTHNLLGTGPNFSFPIDVVVVSQVIPEPSAIFLGAIGVFGLLSRRTWK